MAENVIRRQAAVIASTPLQLAGGPFSCMTGGYIFLAPPYIVSKSSSVDYIMLQSVLKMRVHDEHAELNPSSSMFFIMQYVQSVLIQRRSYYSVTTKVQRSTCF